MEITNVTYMRRKNLGNYEHEEISVTAALGMDDKPSEALHTLREFIHAEFYGTTKLPSSAILEKALEPLEPKSEVEGDVPPVIPEEAKEERPKRVRKPKEAKAEEMEEVESPYKSHVDTSGPSDVEPPKSKLPKGTVIYDKEVKEHRSRLATYLGTNHAGWQTKKGKDEIAKFSAGLHGKPFEDAKGNMLESFKLELSEFFG